MRFSTTIALASLACAAPAAAEIIDEKSGTFQGEGGVIFGATGYGIYTFIIKTSAANISVFSANWYFVRASGLIYNGIPIFNGPEQIVATSNVISLSQDYVLQGSFTLKEDRFGGVPYVYNEPGFNNFQYNRPDLGLLVRFATTDTSGVRNYSATFDQVAFVPEPSQWAMMMAGFGAAGAVARRRRRSAVRRNHLKVRQAC